MLHLEESNCSGTCDDGVAVKKYLVFDVFILTAIAVKWKKHTLKIQLFHMSFFIKL
jgi:hypothetical protein